MFSVSTRFKSVFFSTVCVSNYSHEFHRCSFLYVIGVNREDDDYDDNLPAGK